MANEKIPFRYIARNSAGNQLVVSAMAGYNIYVTLVHTNGSVTGNTRFFLHKSGDLTDQRLCLLEATGVPAVAGGMVERSYPFSVPYLIMEDGEGDLRANSDFASYENYLSVTGYYMKVTP